MKKIKLTQGKYALVDDDDFEYLNQWKWILLTGACGHLYATTRCEGRPTLMHRLILGLTDRKIHTDHKDNNGLNNQRDNIRPATCSQNMANRKKALGTSSKFKGVYFYKKTKRWRSVIEVNGKKKSLGEFNVEIDAAKRYNIAAKEIFGQFAVLNIFNDQNQKK